MNHSRPDRVLKIECLDLPQENEPDEGLYDLRRGHQPKEVEYHDIISLRKYLMQVMPNRTEDILDRLQNFKLAYINLDTGEIAS